MGVMSQQDLGCLAVCPRGAQWVMWPRFWKLESQPWKAHIRSLPLTIAIAAQRPQEELGLRSRAVRIPYHHLSDRQMVHKGQQSFVSSPVRARCSGSAPATHLPLTCPRILKALLLCPRPHHWGWSASQLQCRAGSTQLRSRPQAQRWIPGCEPPQ